MDVACSHMACYLYINCAAVISSLRKVVGVFEQDVSQVTLLLGGDKVEPAPSGNLKGKSFL